MAGGNVAAERENLEEGDFPAVAVPFGVCLGFQHVVAAADDLLVGLT
jgi:hypothetical protein